MTPCYHYQRDHDVGDHVGRGRVFKFQLEATRDSMSGSGFAIPPS